MKVAFASTDRVHIDEHFGRCEHFVIWEVGPDLSAFSGIVQVHSDGEDEENKIEARSNAIADCALVYVAQIGGPAAARLVAKRIHPMRSNGGETIQGIIEKLQQVLRDNPPPWMKKAMNQGERPGFVER